MAIDRGQQLLSQARAAALLSRLLKRQLDGEDLPVMAWRVHNAGCLLIGEPSPGDDPRSAVEAWARHLGLSQRVERPALGDLHLTVRGRVEDVQVALQATMKGKGEVSE